MSVDLIHRVIDHLSTLIVAIFLQLIPNNAMKSIYTTGIVQVDGPWFDIKSLRKDIKPSALLLHEF